MELSICAVQTRCVKYNWFQFSHDKDNRVAMLIVVNITVIFNSSVLTESLETRQEWQGNCE